MKRESVDSTVPVLAASYFPSKMYAFSLNLFFLALFRGSGQTKCGPLYIQQTNEVWLRVLLRSHLHFIYLSNFEMLSKLKIRFPVNGFKDTGSFIED